MTPWILALTACFLLPGGADTGEGAQPGECEDRADNDQDGLYDCLDPGCEADPACATGNTGIPTGAPTGQGGVTGTQTGTPTGTQTGTPTGTQTGTVTGSGTGTVTGSGTGTATGTTDTWDTGLTATGALVTVNWLEQGAYDRVQVIGGTPPAGNWDFFGMADTGYGFYGWTAEDCYRGWSYTYTGYPPFQYNYCHPFDGNLQLQQVYPYVTAVIEGQSTLLPADGQWGYTYVVGTTAGTCYSWGHQPSWYNGMGCLPLP